MMRNSPRRVLTPEEHRIVKKWTLGVLVLYAVIAVAVLGAAGLRQHLGDGLSQSAARAVSTPAAAREQRNRSGALR
jgi:hypothetical protein